MIKMIATDKLTPGMIVGKDLRTENSRLLAARMTILTQGEINRLNKYEIKRIPIYFEDDDLKEEIEKNLEHQKLTEINRLRQTEDWQKFKNSFNEASKVAERVLDDIAIRGNDVNVLYIKDMIDQVLNISNSGLYLFDMLHCMRDLDDLTYAHSLCVALICNVFGQWLKWPDEEIEVLKLAGFFHDIGKIRIPDDIILKRGALTKSEYEIIKKHSEFGYDILKNQEIDERIKNAALCHHERCDNSGYPRGLGKDEIDDISKIVAIADTYEAMTATRCYRGAICPFKVVKELEENGFEKYDPQFMVPLLEMVVQSYVGNSVMLSNGQDGQVVLINHQDLSRPIVKIGDTYVNLAKERYLTIESLI